MTPSRSKDRSIALTMRFTPGLLNSLLGLLRSIGRSRNAPRIILVLWLRNPVQRGLVSSLVHLRLLLVNFPIIAAIAFAAHLGVRRHRYHREYRHRCGEGLHACRLLPPRTTVREGNWIIPCLWLRSGFKLICGC